MSLLVVGVDSSTQSCKVELRRAADFELVATGQAAHPPTTPPVSEQDPRRWWEAFVSAFRSALSQVPEGRVGAISIAGQCHALVALDDRGEPIRPAKLWNDTTSSAALRRVIREVGAEALVRRTGSLPTAAFTLGKVAWLAEHEPESFARMRMMLLPHDYLTYRLTGVYVSDRSEASGTAYFDAATNAYCYDFLRAVDPDKEWEEMVPRVAGPDEAVGEVLPAAAAELGLEGRVLVGAGGGDQHASAVGLGLAPSDVAFALGTSGVVLTPSPSPVRDLSGVINGVAGMQGGFLPLACTLNAAKVTDSFRRWLGVDHAELSRLALAAVGEGPTLAAFLDGERTPDRPGAAGLLADLRSDTTREQLARAAYEGVVFGLVAALVRFGDAGVATDGRVLAVGGGSRATAYNQFLADAIARPVCVADLEESVARGAGLQALAVLGGTTLADELIAHRPSIRVAAEPRPGGSQRWERYQQVAAITELDRTDGENS